MTPKSDAVPSLAPAASAEGALARVKPAVRALGAYTLRPYAAAVKLNQNESPYDVPAALKARIAARVAERPWNRYPAFVPAGLTAAVSAATGWPEEGVLVGNGSNELIQAALAVSVGPGAAVVVPEPTFTLYRLMTAVNGGRVVAVPADGELRFDVDAVVAAARDADAAVVVLCTPNNPTGAALTRGDVARVHDETGALVLVDQAYVEFGGDDAVPLLPDHPRLVVLRTFSKAMSMAGLRAGYALMHPDLAREVAKAKLPYNLDFVAEAAAAELLRGDPLGPQVARVVAERERLLGEMRGVAGIRVFPSAANFLCFRVEPPHDHRVLFRRLLEEHGVLVRDVSSYPLLERCLRVSVGTPEEDDAFLAGLRAVLGEEEGR